MAGTSRSSADHCTTRTDVIELARDDMEKTPTDLLALKMHIGNTRDDVIRSLRSTEGKPTQERRDALPDFNAIYGCETCARRYRSLIIVLLALRSEGERRREMK